ncbi:MAG: hypothetical protein KDD44_02695 [Bdellovibrionales bacterium]|nr:hypothetical protein [Bdellovibrionales bacterium]
MAPLTPYFIMLAVCMLVIGIGVGVLLTSSGVRKKLEKAYSKGKSDADAEKAKVSEELADELGRIRQGLFDSLAAYESATRVVREKLQLPVDQLRKLEAPAERQLSLEFTASAQQPMAAKESRRSEPASADAVRTEAGATDTRSTTPSDDFRTTDRAEVTEQPEDHQAAPDAQERSPEQSADLRGRVSGNGTSAVGMQ